MTAPTSLERIPLLDLAAQHAAIREELDAALGAVLDHGVFVLGPEVEAFEREFAAYCESPFAVGCASGSDALLLALMAHGIGPGDDVLCPAFTFVATATAIVRLGARPVFMDIERSTLDCSPDIARAAAERCARLRAIVPVDLFGRAADLPGFEALGRELEVPIIEDAAQSVGARDHDGARTGSRGDIGCFSLYPTKNLAAIGDAGVLTCHDPELADRLRSLRVHGEENRYVHTRLGINSRLDTLQAAALLVKLRHLDGWTKARRENAAHYDRVFVSAGARRGGEPYSGSGPDLEIPRATTGSAVHVQHLYVIRVPASDRDALRAHLGARGIASQVYYPLGLHQQPCFADLDVQPGTLPETEAAARETLVLPVHPELRADQRDRVAGAVLSYFDCKETRA